MPGCSSSVAATATAHAGALAGLQQAPPERDARYAIAWFDAHGDFNTPDDDAVRQRLGHALRDAAAAAAMPDLVKACAAANGPTVWSRTPPCSARQVLDETGVADARGLAASPSSAPGWPGVREVGGSLMDVVSFEEANLVSVLVNGWEPGSLLFRGIRDARGGPSGRATRKVAMLGRVLAMNLNKKVGDTCQHRGRAVPGRRDLRERQPVRERRPDRPPARAAADDGTAGVGHGLRGGRRGGRPPVGRGAGPADRGGRARAWRRSRRATTSRGTSRSGWSRRWPGRPR